jgi:hypothetical protein
LTSELIYLSPEMRLRTLDQFGESAEETAAGFTAVERHSSFTYGPRTTTGKTLPDRAEATGMSDGDESSDADPPETSVPDADLPEEWTVWNDEPGGRRILAYRPDVFDADQFPAACMPTLYVAAGQPNRPASETEYGRTKVWRVEFFLEPDVELVPARTRDTRAEAIEEARDLAAEFARGELDYRGAYQVPREEYLDELDVLTGKSDSERVRDA